MRNVWVLRVYLHDAVSAAVYCGHLCDYLISVEALSELQLTGVSGDAPITRLAEALRDHRYTVVYIGSLSARSREGTSPFTSTHHRFAVLHLSVGVYKQRELQTGVQTWGQWGRGGCRWGFAYVWDFHGRTAWGLPWGGGGAEGGGLAQGLG